MVFIDGDFYIKRGYNLKSKEKQMYNVIYDLPQEEFAGVCSLHNYVAEDLLSDSEVTVYRNYKDNLFKLIFGRPGEEQSLLDLYNALNGSDYKSTEDLTINTLEDVIYIQMKNDVSFVIKSDMVLLEHQSSFNPNMPLRGLLYFAKLYHGYIESSKKRKYLLYSSSLLTIPTPRYIVLYNGTDKKFGDKQILKLSEAFENPEKTEGFEWTATMLNINTGHNQEILLKCKRLREYSTFIGLVRYYQNMEKSLEEAVDLSIKEALKMGILEDFLKEHRAEVKMSILTEFNKKEYEEGFFEFVEELKAKAKADAEAKTRAEKAEAEAKTRVEKAEARVEKAEARADNTKLDTLFELLRDNLITLEVAAERMKLSPEAFLEATKRLPNI